MPKWLNTAGPCKADIHYMRPPLVRLPQVDRLIAQQGYLSSMPPAKVAKPPPCSPWPNNLPPADSTPPSWFPPKWERPFPTTPEQPDDLRPGVVEQAAPFPHDPGAAEAVMLGSWRDSPEAYLPAELQPPQWPHADPPPVCLKSLGQSLPSTPRDLH